VSDRSERAGDGTELLFEPIRVGPVVLRNRVAVTAHTPNFAVDHRVSDRHLAYHRRRAAGGVGLIVTEGLRVHPTSLRRPDTLSIWSDDGIEAMARLVDAVHAEGATLFGQILHSGREAADDYPRTPSWGPSPIAWSAGAAVPHAMTVDEIDELLECYAAGARRLVAAGFAGVEVHLGHGHLLQQFLSPVTNHRDDAYGGSPAARRKLVDEVIAAVRTHLPDDRALGVRISADEFLEGGLDVSAMAPLAADLVSRHGLDYVNVSHSAYVGGPSLATQMADMAFGAAPFRHLPAAVRRAVDVPVLMACRVETLEDGHELIRSGHADIVALTRAHIADPDLVVKARAGRRPRRCVACLQLCVGRTSSGLPMSCVVNPEVGLEERWPVAVAPILAGLGSTRPRVLVVGAGPSGAEAATALAGHADVDVVDVSTVAGGRLGVAARMQGRQGWRYLLEDQAAELDRLGVVVRRGVSWDPSLLAGVAGVVVAWGATVEPRHVAGLGPMRLVANAVDEVASGAVVAVYDDTGSWEAFGPVEHLVAAGATVHYVTPLASLAANITMYSRLGLLDRLRSTGRLRVHLGRRPSSWSAGVVGLVSTLDAATETIQVDDLVDVGDRRPRPAPVDLERPHVVIGDAYAPRDAGWAVYSGRVGALRLLARVGLDDRDQRVAAERRLDALPLLGIEVPAAAGRA